jgi:hypothetical protein
VNGVQGSVYAAANPKLLRSALGHKRTLRLVSPMSAIPPKADIAECDRHVEPLPKLKLDIAGQSENGSDNGIRRDRDEVRHKI